MGEPRWRRYSRFFKHDPASDVDDELTFHFAQRVEQFRNAGLSAEAARARAREQFGDESAVRAELIGIGRRISRRRNAGAHIESILADLRTNVRSLRRRPAFSVAIILTLTLGLGVNAAMFSFLDRVFLRAPSGVGDPGTLRRLWTIEHDRKG